MTTIVENVLPHLKVSVLKLLTKQAEKIYSQMGRLTPMKLQ